MEDDDPKGEVSTVLCKHLHCMSYIYCVNQYRILTKISPLKLMKTSSRKMKGKKTRKKAHTR